MKSKISVEEAIDILCALPMDRESELVPLAQAQDRVLAEDVRAIINVPPFDRSPYDGYAFRGEDTAGATPDKPAVLRITEELPAGTAPSVAVTEGMCAKILTGAPVPAGANAIIKYELTEFTDEYVKIFQSVPPDTDIVYAGEDVAKGKLIAKRGDVIGPALAGAMAGQGIARVKVYRRPKIFVMSTGSELLEPGEELQPAKIYNSNVFTISAYLENMGAQCVSGGSVRDDAQVIAEKINAALAECDMVVTTGGASVGDYDYAVRASQMTGANVLFWKIAMKPGGSVVAAEKDGKLILSLSGNPGAATLTLLRVAAPYIKALCGMSDTAYEPIEMVLGEDFNKKSPQRRIIRGHLDLHGGKAALVPMKGQGNGMVSSMIGCDLLGDIPAGSPPLKAGDKILAYRV